MKPQVPSNSVQIEACEWLIRVRDMEQDPLDPIPDPAARMQAFIAWISESPSHLQAAQEAVEASRCLRQVHGYSATRRPVPDVWRPETLLELADRVVCFFHLGPKIPGAAARPWSICISLLMLLLVPLLLQTVNAVPASYRTSVGGRVFVSLEDHSTVELNTRTHIEVLYGPHSRQVTLVSGEAIFDVRHDPSRPFRVISGDTVVEDISTRFAVYRHADDTSTVTVLEGRVMVSSLVGKQDLDGGQTVTVGGRSRQPTFHKAVTLSPHELKRRLSWQDGELWFEGETLAEAVAEFNRYNEKQLVIEDPTIANLLLGGRFQAQDVDAFVATLGQLFALRAEPMRNGASVIELKRQ